MSQQEIIQLMCTALKRYYEFMGKGDNYHYTFSKYCDDNGMDHEIIDEEVENETLEPGSSLLADFGDDHDTFPFKDPDTTDDEKKKIIGAVIVQCYHEPDCAWNLC